MKKFFEKFKNNILIFTILIATIFVALHFCIGLLNIRFRIWIYYFIAVFTILGIVGGSIQLLKKKKNIIVKIIVLIVLVMFVISSPVIYIGLVFAYTPEHVVKKNGKKYVACVRSFLDVDVDYYDYINFFLVGKKIRISEYYGNGGYDPFDYKYERKPLWYHCYDDNGKVIDTDDEYYNIELKRKEIPTNKNIVIDFSESENNKTQNNVSESHEEVHIKEGDTLYEKKINKKTSIKVIYKGSILAQRSVIGIEKTTDGGKTWNNQLETTDGFMQINDGAKFIFLDESIGFINDLGLAGTNGENSGLLVTTDGGKNFDESTIIKGNINDELYIDGVPYIEKDILKIKVYTIENSRKKYYEFYSSDDGKTWKQLL